MGYVVGPRSNGRKCLSSLLSSSSRINPVQHFEVDIVVGLGLFNRNHNSTQLTGYISSRLGMRINTNEETADIKSRFKHTEGNFGVDAPSYIDPVHSCAERFVEYFARIKISSTYCCHTILLPPFFPIAILVPIVSVLPLPLPSCYITSMSPSCCFCRHLLQSALQIMCIRLILNLPARLLL